MTAFLRILFFSQAIFFTQVLCADDARFPVPGTMLDVDVFGGDVDLSREYSHEPSCENSFCSVASSCGSSAGSDVAVEHLKEKILQAAQAWIYLLVKKQQKTPSEEEIFALTWLLSNSIGIAFYSHELKLRNNYEWDGLRVLESGKIVFVEEKTNTFGDCGLATKQICHKLLLFSTFKQIWKKKIDDFLQELRETQKLRETKYQENAGLSPRQILDLLAQHFIGYQHLNLNTINLKGPRRPFSAESEAEYYKNIVNSISRVVLPKEKKQGLIAEIEGIAKREDWLKEFRLFKRSSIEPCVDAHNKLVDRTPSLTFRLSIPMPDSSKVSTNTPFPHRLLSSLIMIELVTLGICNHSLLEEMEAILKRDERPIPRPVAKAFFRFRSSANLVGDNTTPFAKEQKLTEWIGLGEPEIEQAIQTILYEKRGCNHIRKFLLAPPFPTLTEISDDVQNEINEHLAGNMPKFFELYSVLIMKLRLSSVLYQIQFGDFPSIEKSDGYYAQEDCYLGCYKKDDFYLNFLFSFPKQEDLTLHAWLESDSIGISYTNTFGTNDFETQPEGRRRFSSSHEPNKVRSTFTSCFQLFCLTPEYTSVFGELESADSGPESRARLFQNKINLGALDDIFEQAGAEAGAEAEAAEGELPHETH